MATRRDGPTTMKDLPPSVREALLRCTPQQRRFVMAYCGRAAGNGTLAIQLAGGKGDYGSRAAAASDTLKDPNVQAARDAWMTAYALGAAEITFRLADMTRCSLEPFLENGPSGAVQLRGQTDESWARYAHWIKSVEVDPKTRRVTKLQVHDPYRALELMAKILKLHSDAPQINTFLYLQSLSDEELLQVYERASETTGFGAPEPSPN